MVQRQAARGGDLPAITNVFVLMLENHSFDHVFAMSGIPGIRAATTSQSNTYTGADGKPHTCYVQASAPPNMTTDPGHEFPDVLQQLCNLKPCCAGRPPAWPGECDDHAPCYKGGAYPPVTLSGFAQSYATSRSEETGLPAAANVGDIMACFDTVKQLPVIHQLAREYAVCDAWFSSIPGPTWPNRFFVHGASSSGMDRSPSLLEEVSWETVHGFSYAHGSIFDALRGKHAWRLYQDKDNLYSDQPSHWAQGGWISQVASLKGVSLRDIRSLQHFAADLQERSEDHTAAYLKYPYTFIEPNFGASFFSSQGQNHGPRYNGGSSQHPEDNMYGGERLIKAVYEAIRNSPVWDTSLLIVVYDEHGGFYDSVTPPRPAPSPDDLSPEQIEASKLNRYGFDFTHYGVRVPAVIVSPLIPKNTVDHTLYDHSSILRTLGKWLNVGPLTRRDARANDLWPLLSLPTPRGDADCPRALVEPAPPQRVSPGDAAPALAAEADRALPESGNMIGFLHVLLKAELEMSGSDPAAAQRFIDAFEKIRTHGHALEYLEQMRERLMQAG